MPLGTYMWGRPTPLQLLMDKLHELTTDPKQFDMQRRTQQYAHLLPTSPFIGPAHVTQSRAHDFFGDDSARMQPANQIERDRMYQATTDRSRRGGARMQRYSGMPPAVRAVIDSILFNSTIPPAAMRDTRFMYTPGYYNVQGLFRPRRATPEDTVFITGSADTGTPIHEMQHKLQTYIPNWSGWADELDMHRAVPGESAERDAYMTAPQLQRPIIPPQHRSTLFDYNYPAWRVPGARLADQLLTQYWK